MSSLHRDPSSHLVPPVPRLQFHQGRDLVQPVCWLEEVGLRGDGLTALTDPSTPRAAPAMASDTIAARLIRGTEKTGTKPGTKGSDRPALGLRSQTPHQLSLHWAPGAGGSPQQKVMGGRVGGQAGLDSCSAEKGWCEGDSGPASGLIHTGVIH